MSKLKKILRNTYQVDKRNENEILVEKLKHLRKNEYNMTKTEFGGDLCPAKEITKIENYYINSNASYIRELTKKYVTNLDMVEINRNINDILKEAIIALVKGNKFSCDLNNIALNAEYESNYMNVIRAIKYLIEGDIDNLKININKLITSESSFNKIQSQMLIILTTALEIMMVSYVKAYDTIRLLNNYYIENRYVDLLYKYFLAKTCYYCEDNILTLKYIDDFLLNRYSTMSNEKFVELSAYKLILLADTDKEYAIKYGDDMNILRPSNYISLLLNIIKDGEFNEEEVYEIDLFQALVLYKYDRIKDVKYQIKGSVDRVNENIVKYFDDTSNMDFLRKYILPFCKRENPFFYNILNQANLEELESRSRYKDMIRYIGTRRMKSNKKY